MISYKPLFKTMKQKGITTYTLIHKYNFSPSTINRLIKDQSITVEKVNELCDILDCDIKDVMAYSKTQTEYAFMDYLYDLIYTNGRFMRDAAETFCHDIINILKPKLKDTEEDSLYIFLSLSINWLYIECNPDDVTVLSLLKLIKNEIHCDTYLESATVFDILMSDAAEKNDLIYYLYRHYKEKYHLLPSNGLELLDDAFQTYFTERNIPYSSLLNDLEKHPAALKSELIGKEKAAKLISRKAVKQDVPQ